LLCYKKFNTIRRIKKIDRLNVVGSGLVEIEKFWNSRSKTYFLKNNNNILDFVVFFKLAKPILVNKLKSLCIKTFYKFNLFVDCKYERVNPPEICDVAFKTENVPVYSGSNFQP